MIAPCRIRIQQTAECGSLQRAGFGEQLRQWRSEVRGQGFITQWIAKRNRDGPIATNLQNRREAIEFARKLGLSAPGDRR